MRDRHLQTVPAGNDIGLVRCTQHLDQLLVVPDSLRAAWFRVFVTGWEFFVSLLRVGPNCAMNSHSLWKGPWLQHVFAEACMNELVRYLLDNLIIDFQGDLNLDMARQFLRNDNSPAAQALLTKLYEDGGVSDMLITVADCLKEQLPGGVDEEVIREQVQVYAES